MGLAAHSDSLREGGIKKGEADGEGAEGSAGEHPMSS